MESHAPRKLDTEMAKTANALHRDRSPPRKPAFRKALYVVMPAHRSGAASTEVRSSGIEASPRDSAIITSA